MKISDEEYEVLSKIAFSQCDRNCKECKYYFPETDYGCFALDVLYFVLFIVKEGQNEQKRISSNASTNKPNQKP